VSTMEKQEFELIDVEDFDKDSMEFLFHSHDRCEVCLQWIQRLICEANDSTLIKVAPPILSRVYNQLGNGIVNLNNARKITEFPIPFPLAQMITFMLLFHWLITAFICAASVERSFWAGILSFIVTFSFQSINYIAMELEMPFGDDANDLPLHDMQTDLNKSIKALMDHRAQNPPAFTFQKKHKGMLCRGQSMEDVFAGVFKKGHDTSNDDDMAGSQDNEKSSENAIVLQEATVHGAQPKELAVGSSTSVQMPREPPVILPSTTPEIWFHMGPKDDKSTWRPDVEAPWTAQSMLSVTPLPLSGAPTVSPQVAPLPDLPVQLEPPPVWEPVPPSATWSLADPMFGAPTSEKPRLAYRAPGISTTTRDAAGLPVRLQAQQEYNDAALFPAPKAAPSMVWASNKHDTSDQVRVTSHIPGDHKGISFRGVGLGGSQALSKDKHAT